MIYYYTFVKDGYSQYETGVIALTAEHLVTLADFYHVSVDYLLGRTAKPEMNE